MSIAFSQIPTDLLVPGGYTEFDSSLAGTLSSQPKILLVGRSHTNGSVGLNVIQRVQSVAQAIELFGLRSPLKVMCAIVLAINFGAELYAVAVASVAPPVAAADAPDSQSPVAEEVAAPLDYAPLIAVMGGEAFDYIALGEGVASANLLKMRTELDRRWGALQGMEGHAFVVQNNHAFDDIAALTAELNSSHFTFLPVRGANNAPHIWLATLVAVVANHYGNDPAAPPTDLELPGLLPPDEPYSKREANDMLHAGQSVFRVSGGKVYLSYLVTTYQTNAQGEKDSAARDFEVPEILKNFRRLKHYYVMRTYSGYKVAQDASGYGAGQKIIDPAEVKGYLYDLYINLFMRDKGWMQNAKNYLDTMIVEIATNNDDRINVWDQPTLIGQFRVFANKTSYITK